MEIEFTKMHGAGNDYIYVNTLRYPIDNPEELSVEWSRYHTGIVPTDWFLSALQTRPTLKCVYSMPTAPKLACAETPAVASANIYTKKVLPTKTDIQLETLSGIKIFTPAPQR